MAKGPIRGPGFEAVFGTEVLLTARDDSAALSGSCRPKCPAARIRGESHSAPVARARADRRADAKRDGPEAVPSRRGGGALRRCECYCRSLRIVCGTAFAWASIAVPACKRIWFLVK